MGPCPPGRRPTGGRGAGTLLGNHGLLPPPPTGCPPVQLRLGPQPSLAGKTVATWLFFQNNLLDSASLKALAVTLREETPDF